MSDEKSKIDKEILKNLVRLCLRTISTREAENKTKAQLVSDMFNHFEKEIKK